MRPLPLSASGLLAAAAAAGSNPPTRSDSLHDCVAKVFGQEADARVVSPSSETYTDARMGESIQKTARVGAGIRLGALYTALSRHGRDWPGGICPTVGLSGFLGAGGFNMQMRRLGLARRPRRRRPRRPRRRPLPRRQPPPLDINVVQQPFAPLDGRPPFAWNQTRQDPDAPRALPRARFRRISKSFFVQKDRPLTLHTIRALVDRLTELPDEAAGWGEWHAWNITGPGDQAAFAWRDQAYAHLEFILTGSAHEAELARPRQWADGLEGYLRPRVGPASYPGYMDASISTDLLSSYYGHNVRNLSRIKRKYDPFNFFNPLGIRSAV